MRMKSTEAKLTDACQHPYRKKAGSGFYCSACGEYFQGSDKSEHSPLIMPPSVFRLTRGWWSFYAPWPHISVDLAKKYGWYLTLDGSITRLVMPVFRSGKPVFYSARMIGSFKGLKYKYPKGVAKSIWVSRDKLISPVAVCEGVADAVYASQVFGSSVGLLGNFIGDGDFSILAGKVVVLLLDGDVQGKMGTARLVKQLASIARVYPVYLPEGCDPTDLPIKKLRKIKNEIISIIGSV